MTTATEATEGGPDESRVTQTASGHNVIQQVGSGVARIFDVDVNVSVLGGLVIGAPVLVLTVTLAVLLTRAPPLLPLEGPGLKVAVAALTGPGTAGERVGAFVAEALQQSLAPDDFTVAGPTRVREVPVDAASASRTADALFADVVVYGEVTPAAGAEGTVSAEPRLVVASQGTRDSLPFVLDAAWGSGFAVVPDDLGSVEATTVASLQALVSFVGAVGALATDNFPRARDRLEAARSALPPADVATRATVETMAGWLELRAAAVDGDPALLRAADERFGEALGLDASAELAGVGRLAVAYMELVRPGGTVGDDARERLPGLVADLDAAAAAADDPYARVTAEALAGQAQLALVERPGAGLDDAVTRLTATLRTLPDVQERPWGLFDSFLHEKLGLAAAIAGDVPTAIDHYRLASRRASPFWAAFHLAAVGELELDRGDGCSALAAFEAAASTVRGRFDDEAAAYAARAAEAGARCEAGATALSSGRGGSGGS